MSRPVSPAVYRRRRIVAVVALVLVLFLVWQVVGLVTGGDDDPTPAATPTPSATTAEPEPEESPEPTQAAEGTTQVTLTSAEDACAPEKVRITPTVPGGQTAGGPVRVDLAVSTASDVPCTLTPEAADLLVVVSSGGTPVFDSTSCVGSLLTQPVPLSPRWASVVTVTWNGRSSGAACSDAEGFVGEGGYVIQLGTLGGEPGKDEFMLAAAPAPPPVEEPPAEQPPAEQPPADPTPEEIPPTG